MKILKDLGWFFRKEKRSYILGIASLFAISVLNLIPPMILGNVIDQITESSLTPVRLAYGIGVLLLTALAMYALRYLWRIFIFGTSFRLENEMRNTLFEHFTKMSASFYHQHRVGDLMAHATNDLKSVQAVAGSGVLQLADSALSGLTVLFAMFFGINWKLTIVAVLPMPLLVIGSQYLSKRLHKSFNVAQEAFSEMNNRVLENINGMKVTKTFGQEAFEIDNFKGIVDDVYKKNLKVTRYDAVFDPMVIMIITLSMILTFSVGVYLVSRGEITTGNFVTFINYIHQLTWPMMAIGFMFNTMNRGHVSYERIQKLLDMPQDIMNKDGASYNIPKGNIEFTIDTFRYPDQDDIRHVEDVSFVLNAGETLGIVGKTGSGKSTIIKLLLREYDIYEGSILFGGTSIKDYDVSHYRDAFGYVPQDPFLFSMSILDNIRFGNPDATLEDVRNAARVADVDEDIQGFEQRYDTVIGERGVSLSGGQKQRIAMARAILLNPECLILDDALSAVDAKTEEIILGNLKSLRQDKTTIIIAHRFSALQHAQNILVMDDGHVVESGNHFELMRNMGWYAEIFKLQEFSKEAKSHE